MSLFQKILLIILAGLIGFLGVGYGYKIFAHYIFMPYTRCLGAGCIFLDEFTVQATAVILLSLFIVIQLIGALKENKPKMSDWLLGLIIAWVVLFFILPFIAMFGLVNSIQ